MQETLEKIGLTKNEAKVYLALVKTGDSLASTIAKITNLHRRPVYDSLDKLIEKGLVSYNIKSGKKYFQAQNPEKILSILKDKENEIKHILPELISKFNATKPEVFSEIYEGKEGLKTVMELILKENKDWLSIGSTGKGPSVIPYFLEHWHKKRIKQKIQFKTLIADTPEGRERTKKFSKIGLAKVKFLPKKIKHPQTIWIFGNKVAIILVSMEHLTIFLIDNKEVAVSFRDYFNYMWASKK